jgi:hypothetical protein
MPDAHGTSREKSIAAEAAPTVKRRSIAAEANNEAATRERSSKPAPAFAAFVGGHSCPTPFGRVTAKSIATEVAPTVAPAVDRGVRLIESIDEQHVVGHGHLNIDEIRVRAADDQGRDSLRCVCAE